MRSLSMSIVLVWKRSSPDRNGPQAAVRFRGSLRDAAAASAIRRVYREGPECGAAGLFESDRGAGSVGSGGGSSGSVFQ
jgi:hypothetical protein